MVGLALCLPLFADRPALYLDWQHHLYLLGKQASHVREHLAPTYFVSTIDRGWFYPFFVFYGGTLYYLVALLGVALGSVWAAYVSSYLVAVMAAFAGWTWFCRQAGLRGWLAYLPGLVYVGGAYYLTNAYGRGAWPEFVATSALPLALAASWCVLAGDRVTLRALMILTASVVVMTGSHAITLLLSLPFLIGALGVGLAIRRPPAAQPPRLASALGAVALGIGINAWFLLPLLAYRGTLNSQPIEEIARAFDLARALNRLDVIFSLVPTNPLAWSTPHLYVQAPLIPLLVAVIVIGVGLRVVRDGRLAAFAAAALTGFVAILVLIVGDSLWDALPRGANVIQFPYRLNTYLLACASGLVLVACRYANRIEALRPGWRVGRGLVTVAVVVQVGFGLHQAWTVQSYGRADDVLADLDRLPRDFYDVAYFNASASRIENPQLGVSAHASSLDASAVELVVPPGESRRLVGTNVVLSPLIGFDPPILVGQANGYAVLDVPPSTGPTRVVVGSVQTPATIAGGLTTLVSVLGLFGGSWWALARRRTGDLRAGRVADARSGTGVGDARALLRRFAPTVGLLTATGLVYSFFATGGTWGFRQSFSPYYELLAQAFLAGQLHLTLPPDPQLLALPNPYDPDQNAAIRLRQLHDASLYQGRYYLYWGPLPGLLHAAWRLVTGWALYDSVAQAVATLAACLGFLLILQRLRARYLPAAAWIVWGSSLAFGLGGIMLYMVGRPSVYHEAVVAAMGLLVLAWYAFLRACEPGPSRRRYLLVSGVLLACAVGSRVTYVAYAGGIGLVLCWACLRAERGTRRPTLLDLVSFSAPIALTLVLLGLYNLLRFDSPSEFGTRYMLQGSPAYYEMARRPDGTLGSFLSLAVVIPNLVLYLFAIPALDLLYPYLAFDAPFAGFPYTGTGLLFPDVAAYETLVETPIVSAFLLAPVGLLALLTPIFFARPRPPVLGPARMWAAGVGLGLLAMLPVLSTARGATARYSADVLPALTLLGSSVLLAWSSGAIAGRGTRLRWPISAPRGQTGLLAFATTAWGCSLLFGVLLGLGSWVYSFQPQAMGVQAISNEWIGWLGQALRPSEVQPWTEPVGRTTWRQADGHYLKDGTIYLRAPGPGTVLFVSFASELPPGHELAVRVNGETAIRGPMLAGQQLWWTPPLTAASANTVVPIRLELPSQATLGPGSRLPLVVSSVRFASTPEEADRYRRSMRN